MAGLDDVFRWWQSVQAKRRTAQGLDPEISPETAAFAAGQDQPPGVAPPGTPGSSTTEMGPPSPPAASAPQAVELPAGVAGATPLPFAADTKDDLERMENDRTQMDNDLREAYRMRGVAADERAKATNPSVRERATTAYDAADKVVKSLQGDVATQTARIAVERNRRQDDADKKKKDEETKKATPVNGQRREVPFDYKLPNGQTVTGLKTEEYQNGTWGYVEGSSRREPGSQPQGPAQITSSVLTDGRGNSYLVDTATGKTTQLNGPRGAVQTLNDPDGTVYLQGPDGGKGAKLFDALPLTSTEDGFLVGRDRRNGAELYRVDTKTAEGRALADRLERATVEAAEAGNQPKFASAIAQYQQEVSRRQGLARTELQRLQDLQKSGQLSPETASAQFDRWMQTNVEGPLSGFRAAAEQERQRQEQENLTRQASENTRVETANRERGRLGYEAGEAAKAQALEVGLQTRSPAYIAQMGNFAQSLGQGKTDFNFDPKALDIAGFQAVQPDYTAVADQAMQRLFGMMPEAKAQNVNTPLPALPTGPDLRSLMDGVRYSGPSSPGASGALSAPIEGDPGVPGQQAIDLKDQGKPGYARTVYANGKYFDWQIPQTAGALPQPTVAPPSLPATGAAAAPMLPGQLPGETPEQRQARYAAILAR